MAKLFIFSTSKNKFSKINCVECGETSVIGHLDNKCPMCYESLDKKKKKGLKAKLDNKTRLEARLQCTSCKKLIFSNSKLDNEKLITQNFCPNCGSSDLKPSKSNSNSSDDSNLNLDPEEELELDVEEDLDLDLVSPDSTNDNSESEQQQIEEEIEEDEDEIVEELESDLEAALITNPKSWVFFKAGTPVFKLVKSNLNSDSQLLFDSESFVEVFETRLKEVGLNAALKEFNAEIISPETMMSSFEIEEMAYTHLNDKIMPKFTECMALAVEGACKSVYPELNSELKAQFFDELLAQGLTQDKAVQVIESGFGAGSQTLFQAIIAKALELLGKDETSFLEIKSTIQASGSINSVVNINSTVSEEELITREKLNASSNMNFSVKNLSSGFKNLHSQTVKAVRSKIKFK